MSCLSAGLAVSQHSITCGLSAATCAQLLVQAILARAAPLGIRRATGRYVKAVLRARASASSVVRWTGNPSLQMLSGLPMPQRVCSGSGLISGAAAGADSDGVGREMELSCTTLAFHACCASPTLSPYAMHSYQVSDPQSQMTVHLLDRDLALGLQLCIGSCLYDVSLPLGRQLVAAMLPIWLPRHGNLAAHARRHFPHSCPRDCSRLCL